MRWPLSQQLEDNFDPTDANAASEVAEKALILLRTCQRVLFANNAGMRVGRDDGLALAVHMRDLGAAMCILDHYAGAKESTAFHKALEHEAGLISIGSAR
jgi:hypothetical protein